MSRLSKREARAWVRSHFAEYIDLAEPPEQAPVEVAEIWADETLRIARRIDPANYWTRDKGVGE